MPASLAPDPLPPASTICFSLISHTNVGKTTLARTLLRRDVGQVLDSEHVTDIAEAHTMVEMPNGARLLLWDTPGFGDSARLAKRLKKSAQPLRAFLLETWDRFRNRSLWCSQQAVKNVQEDADVVLYLIDATQRPEDNAFVGIEMEILEWIGKPIVVLLNQLGQASNPAEIQHEIQLWEQQLAKFPHVKRVLALDAFTQCWVQELALLEAVTDSVPAAKLPVYAELKSAWQATHQQVFEKSMREMAIQLTQSLLDRELAPKESFLQKLGVGRQAWQAAMDRARESLSDRLAQRSLRSSDLLIELHQLAGRREEMLREASDGQLQLPKQVNESLWTAVGGLLTGAAAGVAAELKTGGLLLGGGAIVGTFAGGAGAYLLAKGYNLSKAGNDDLRWTEDHFLAQVETALLFYLAVCHWGRGRGDWRESKAPAQWKELTRTAVQKQKKELAFLWKEAGDKDVHKEELAAELEDTLTDITEQIFAQLY